MHSTGRGKRERKNGGRVCIWATEVIILQLLHLWQEASASGGCFKERDGKAWGGWLPLSRKAIGLRPLAVPADCRISPSTLSFSLPLQLMNAVLFFFPVFIPFPYSSKPLGNLHICKLYFSLFPFFPPLPPYKYTISHVPFVLTRNPVQSRPHATKLKGSCTLVITNCKVCRLLAI